MKPGIPWFTFQFHVYTDVIAIHYGDRRVTRIDRSNDEAVNAVVDVLEAAGFSPVQMATHSYPMPPD